MRNGALQNIHKMFESLPFGSTQGGSQENRANDLPVNCVNNPNRVNDDSGDQLILDSQIKDFCLMADLQSFDPVVHDAIFLFYSNRLSAVILRAVMHLTLHNAVLPPLITGMITPFVSQISPKLPSSVFGAASVFENYGSKHRKLFKMPFIRSQTIHTVVNSWNSLLSQHPVKIIPTGSICSKISVASHLDLLFCLTDEFLMQDPLLYFLNKLIECGIGIEHAEKIGQNRYLFLTKINNHIHVCDAKLAKKNAVPSALLWFRGPLCFTNAFCQLVREKHQVTFSPSFVIPNPGMDDALVFEYFEIDYIPPDYR